MFVPARSFAFRALRIRVASGRYGRGVPSNARDFRQLCGPHLGPSPKCFRSDPAIRDASSGFSFQIGSSTPVTCDVPISRRGTLPDFRTDLGQELAPSLIAILPSDAFVFREVRHHCLIEGQQFIVGHQSCGTAFIDRVNAVQPFFKRNARERSRASDSPTVESGPKPMSRSLPFNRYRKTHERLVPAPFFVVVTCRYSPPPSQ